MMKTPCFVYYDCDEYGSVKCPYQGCKDKHLSFKKKEEKLIC